MVSVSSASTVAPRRAAAIARIPEPQPRSSTCMPGVTYCSMKPTHSCVVGCRPVPKHNVIRLGRILQPRGYDHRARADALDGVVLLPGVGPVLFLQRPHAQ